jgi:AraC-like DNA-binding protein
VEGRQRVGVVVELPQVLRDLGADPAKVLPAAGIDLATLRDPENVISFLDLGRLLQVCVIATGCPHFGLLVGQRATSEHFGLVGRLMRNAPTLGDAILDICTNQERYIRGAVTYLVTQDKVAFWGYAIYQPETRNIEQIGDGALAVAFRLMRELTGISPSDVLSSRHGPPDMSPYVQLFGVPPKFNSRQHALVFPKDLLARPVRGVDPKLRKVLEKSVTEHWAVQRITVADRVARVLRPRVVFGKISLEDVANHLSVHPRTLNRKLKDEGTNFRSLLNAARFEVARQLLAGTAIEVSDIALTLGYSETSGFTHAFQRWSGTAPSEWRACV